MISRILLASLVVAGFAANVEARNTKYDLPIAGVTQNPDYQSKLGSDVVFYNLERPSPKISQIDNEHPRPWLA
jgi:hypothetical protein